MSATLSIPRYPSDVTNTWLSGVLSAGRAPVAVDEVTVRPIGTGQTAATYRINATYGSGRSDLPDSFVLKLPAQDDSVRDGLVLGYVSECAFYETVAELVEIPIPHCYHNDIADGGKNFALLLGDEADAVQGDQIGGCGPEQALSVARALAGLHGPTWCDPAWHDFAGLAFATKEPSAISGLSDVAKLSAAMTIDKLGDRLSSGDRETLTAAMDLVTPWLSDSPERFALMHGDFRLDNMLFGSGGKLTVVDWQTLGVGLPARDLAYFVGTSVESDLREAIEEKVVETYHRALLDFGVAEYSFETCWRDYRFGMLQTLLITSLGCAFATGTDRGERLFEVMLRRGCQAIRDLGSLEIVAATG